jgi:hypothetical protein
MHVLNCRAFSKDFAAKDEDVLLIEIASAETLSRMIH